MIENALKENKLTITKILREKKINLGGPTSE